MIPLVLLFYSCKDTNYNQIIKTKADLFCLWIIFMYDSVPLSRGLTRNSFKGTEEGGLGRETTLISQRTQSDIRMLAQQLLGVLHTTGVHEVGEAASALVVDTSRHIVLVDAQLKRQIGELQAFVQVELLAFHQSTDTLHEQHLGLSIPPGRRGGALLSFIGRLIDNLKGGCFGSTLSTSNFGNERRLHLTNTTPHHPCDHSDEHCHDQPQPPA